MESLARIMHFINLNWMTGILELQYIGTVITVMMFQAGPKLDRESHKALFWGLYFFFFI
jgi:hypothetical protein